jgi:RecB family exonuclease
MTQINQHSFPSDQIERLAGAISALSVRGLSSAAPVVPLVPLVPVVVVDSPATGVALAQRLATQGWPGRADGSPLPWCGSLDQAFGQMVDRALAKGLAVSPPRPAELRRVQLAQMLLDHAGLAASLGGSAKAALDLAGQWVDIFQGWEWLQHGHAGFTPQPGDTSFAADIATLAALQQQNRLASDSADWTAAHAPKLPGYGQTMVFFCLGRTPTPLELATAKTLWGAGVDQLQVVLPTPLDFQQSIAQRASSIEPGAVRKCIAAHSVEEAAWSAAQTIMDWRAQGVADIAVVPLDRKIVRRLRALLDRAGEPFADRTGWSLDTSVAAGAVVGLSELLCHRANTQSLLEWIHSPFVAAALQQQFGFGASDRQSLDTALRGYGRIAPVKIHHLLDQHLLPAALQPIQALACDQRLSVHDWVGRLNQALEHCGLFNLLAEDTAGQEIVAALQLLKAQSNSDTLQESVSGPASVSVSASTLVSVSLWQAVLSELLSQSRFSETQTDAAVRVSSIHALCWRPPQAVIMVGADAAHLPQRSVPRFFEPHRLAQMGLQLLPQESEAERFEQFASIWSAAFPMTLIACSDKPDSEVEFSGWIELLSLNQHHLIEKQSATEFIGQRVIHLDPDAPSPLLQAVYTQPLPATLSVSALQSLANCSYQFYLQTLLGLEPMAMLEEEAPPSDLGSLLHLVLKKATPPQAGVEDWQRWLDQEIDRVLGTSFFQKRRDRSVRLPIPVDLAASLRAQAQAVVPGLANWLASRHDPNTQPRLQSILTEEPVSRVLTPLGITINGRIDRIEITENGVHLIDFKTTQAGELKQRVKTVGDDIQLPLYAWLAANAQSLINTQPIVSAAYVSLRREAITEVAVAADSAESLREHTRATLEQLTQKLISIQQGKPILAEGIEKDKKICDRCRVRGICRRDDILIASETQEEGE